MPDPAGRRHPVHRSSCSLMASLRRATRRSTSWGRPRPRDAVEQGQRRARARPAASSTGTATGCRRRGRWAIWATSIQLQRGHLGLGRQVSQARSPISLQLMAYYAQVIATAMLAFPARCLHRLPQRTTPGSGDQHRVDDSRSVFCRCRPFVLAITLVLFLAIGGIEVGGVDIGFKWLPGARYEYRSAKIRVLSTISSTCSCRRCRWARGSASHAVFMRLLRSDMIGSPCSQPLHRPRPSSKGLSLPDPHPVAPRPAPVDVHPVDGDGLQRSVRAHRRRADRRDHLHRSRGSGATCSRRRSCSFDFIVRCRAARW